MPKAKSAFGAAMSKWSPPVNRDPLKLIARQEVTRLADLIPLRHERMRVSPFTFYRGTAIVMAADLASLPVTGLRVQLCGDAHISNFGAYASPERNVVFDLNDFDETLPGPWEWDVLRMATSVVLAARNRGFSDGKARRAVSASAQAYRDAIEQFAGQSPLGVWYEHVKLEDMIASSSGKRRSRLEQYLKAARKRTGERLRPKLTHEDRPRFIEQPPTFRRPFEDDKTAEVLTEVLTKYQQTLPTHVRLLYDRFNAHDLALKVVGVGSVGTICAVSLHLTDRGEALILQIKEAQPSVLEQYAGKSVYANHGERVVHGQRAMQAASDVFLGWTSYDGRDYYVRQLRDMKLSMDLDSVSAGELTRYAEVCARTLARAHARTGDSSAIFQHIGSTNWFADSVGDFSFTYADLAADDHRTFVEALPP